MCKRILVPLDGSQLSESALAPAALLAKRCEADLLLVAAIRAHVFPGLLSSAAGRQVRNIEHYLTMAATPLRAEGITVETAVLSERPARGIALQSEGRGIDLTVMATHGRTGLQALLRSSVTWSVLGQSPVPVLALKHPTGKEGLPAGTKSAAFLDGSCCPDRCAAGWFAAR
jgi:nucleotide-binding universal stress UspA family protein